MSPPVLAFTCDTVSRSVRLLTVWMESPIDYFDTVVHQNTGLLLVMIVACHGRESEDAPQ